MREAVKRSPTMPLYTLQWGAPYWVGHGNFYSQDNINYIIAYHKALANRYGLTVRWQGIWNEKPHNSEWIKKLRRGLDEAGLASVGIVASDECCGVSEWSIADEMATDPALRRAVARVVGHYSGTGSLGLGFGVEPTASAIALGTPLWSSEDGPWRSDWIGAQLMAHILNINYIQGRQTSTSIWSLVTSFYDILPIPNTGLLRANQPWTGHYEVQPAVWAVAHTTQFAAPGWRYLDGASETLPSGGTAISLISPNGSDYSVIAETQGATAPQTITIQPGGLLSQGTIHVWRSDSHANFVHDIDLTPTSGAVSVVLQPDNIYSFTTTSGQRHGTTTDIPAAHVLPVDYADDFSSYAVGATPRLFSDESGSFQVAKRLDGPGNVLRQMVRHEGIVWFPEPQPVTVIGDRTWSNYQVDVDAHADTATQLTVFGRVTAVPETTNPPLGYFAQLGDDGAWSLQAPGGGGTSSILASGTLSFPAHRWHHLSLGMRSAQITLTIDGAVVARVLDYTYINGLAGIGSDFGRADFANFRVQKD